jgi:hypothetical protein
MNLKNLFLAAMTTVVMFLGITVFNAAKADNFNIITAEGENIGCEIQSVNQALAEAKTYGFLVERDITDPDELVAFKQALKTLGINDKGTELKFDRMTFIVHGETSPVQTDWVIISKLGCVTNIFEETPERMEQILIQAGIK